MVLEGAEASSDFTSDPSAPPPDSGTFNDDRRTAMDYGQIDWTKYPKPIPFFGPLLGFTDAYKTRLITARVQSTTQVLKRAPTRDEFDALTFLTLKAIHYQSYGPVLGIAAGLGRTYATREEMRFPLMKKGTLNIDPERFGWGSVTFLKGQQARMAWHCLRGSAYVSLAYTVSAMLMNGYAATVSAVGLQSDPRLKEFSEALVKMFKNPKGEFPERGRQRPVGSAAGRGQRGSRINTPVATDDASPSSDDYTGASDDSFYASTSDDQAPATGEERRRIPIRKAVTAARPVKVESESSSSDSFDDIGPAAGATSGDTSRGGESAWDRIRREAQSGTGASSSRPPRRGRSPMQQQGTTVGDDFAFSSSDAERQYAKDRAQEEFDAQVERERRGGDFNSSRRN
ncbi:hypothetical protein MMC09_006130 [Bachmanniomyces sp. S44760]|nr:hypothetical protein [Bachmanniomyces sp. S44760]